ncbi:MAG TPA: hypothetical protein VML75_26000 [Kofleriaceae bacterium]|nr:hypothetical protein [Kofleriaceae bacterium]
MRGIRTMVVAGACALSLIAGCGDDGGGAIADAAATIDAPVVPDARPDATPVPDATPPIDAREPALGCLGDPIPTTGIADPLTITGNAYNPGILTPDTPINGATIEGFDRGDEITAIVTTTSDASGDFTASLTTNGEPVDSYLRSTAASYWTTYLYPPTPVFMNLTGVTVVMVTDAQFSTLTSFVPVTQDQDLGWVSMVVLDCEGQPIRGATVTSTPAAGDTAYSGNGGIPSLTEPATRADGVAMLFNVPVGDLELSATVSGMTLRTHTVVVSPVSADKMITTAIVP